MTEVDVVVHRCSVRVERRGGWSWGSDPRALPDRVLAALPELLLTQLPARYPSEFAEAAAGDGEVEITEPVTLDVRLTLADLLSWKPVAAEAPFLGAEADVPAEHHVAGSPQPSSETPGPATPGAADARPGSWETLVAAWREAGVPGRLTAEQRAALGMDGEEPARSSPAGAESTRRRRGVSEVEVDSAMPFLLAAALARIGVLEPIGALFPDDGPLLAAALAYKVLSPLRHGWLRTESDRVAAAAFAGLESAPPEEDLADLARRAGPALPSLTAAVGLTVCAGHQPGRPLLVTRPDSGRTRPAGGNVARPENSGVLLAEADGLFPIAWTGDVAGLLPYWQAADRPTVLLTPGMQAPELDGRRPPRTPAMAELTSRLSELTTELGARRAVPPAAGDAFERALALTAGAGLATIAWLLWRHREPTDPQLALARLGDLGALVRFEANEVRVRLPLGRRHADLAEHMLLGDIPHAVWLGGRTLTFTGG